MLDKVFSLLFDHHDAKFILVSFVLDHFDRELDELEKVVNGLSFFLIGISCINKAYIDNAIPEKTMRNLSLSFKMKSSK